MKLEGIELGSSLGTVLTCLNGAGRQEKEMSGLVISQGCEQGRNAEGTYK